MSSTPAPESQSPEGGAPLADEHPVYLQDPVLDATVRMLVELTAEVWVERERRLALEELLSQHGLLAAGALEQFRPNAEQTARLKAERNRFIEQIFKELRRIPMSPARALR